jgi:hypothetical protein
MIIQKYSIHIETETFYVNASNNLLGVIYHSATHVNFPSNNWTDFVPFVVAESVNAVLRIQEQASNSENIYFMEGPYYIHVSSIAINQLQVEFVKRYDTPQVQYRLIVDKRQFRQEVINSTGLFIAKCKELKWQSKDLDEIVSLYTVLLDS